MVMPSCNLRLISNARILRKEGFMAGDGVWVKSPRDVGQSICAFHIISRMADWPIRMQRFRSTWINISLDRINLKRPFPSLSSIIIIGSCIRENKLKLKRTRQKRNSRFIQLRGRTFLRYRLILQQTGKILTRLLLNQDQSAIDSVPMRLGKFE